MGDVNNHGKHNKNTDDDRKFYIDYTVYMPAANPLQIENSFGKIKIPSMTGQVNLTSKFGGLTTGKLSDVDEIDVEFGTANIGSVHNGEVTFKFNSKSVIDQVSGSVKIKSEFSGDVQFTVLDNIEELSVFESYSTIKMTVGKSLSASFDVHTSFGNFHNGTAYTISEEKDDDDSGPKFDKDYSGKAGEGKAKIKIKSSFGKVRLYDSNDRTSANSNDDGDDDDNNDKHHKKEKEKVKVGV